MNARTFKLAGVSVWLLAAAAAVLLALFYQPTADLNLPIWPGPAAEGMPMAERAFRAAHGLDENVEITYWLGAKTGDGPAPTVVKGSETEIVEQIQEAVTEARDFSIGVGTSLYRLCPHDRENPGGWTLLYFKKTPADGLACFEDLNLEEGDDFRRVTDEWVQALVKDGPAGRRLGFFEIIETFMEAFGH